MIGVSNYDVAWLQKAGTVTAIDSLQPPYSLIQRKIEAEILPYCRKVISALSFIPRWSAGC